MSGSLPFFSAMCTSRISLVQVAPVRHVPEKQLCRSVLGLLVFIAADILLADLLFLLTVVGVATPLCLLTTYRAPIGPCWGAREVRYSLPLLPIAGYQPYNLAWHFSHRSSS